MLACSCLSTFESCGAFIKTTFFLSVCRYDCKHFWTAEGLVLHCVLEDVTKLFGPFRFIVYLDRKILKAILQEADRVSAYVFLRIHATSVWNSAQTEFIFVIVLKQFGKNF
jgi:hypothetical protein